MVLLANIDTQASMMCCKAFVSLIIFPLQVPNNYETDLIYPIMEKASELANVSYATADDRTKLHLKVCSHFIC